MGCNLWSTWFITVLWRFKTKTKCSYQESVICSPHTKSYLCTATCKMKPKTRNFTVKIICPLQSTVEPNRKRKCPPQPNLVNIFYDITGCRFIMFDIFEIEWSPIFFDIKVLHLHGGCIQGDLKISLATPWSYSPQNYSQPAIGDRAPVAVCIWCFSVALWPSKDVWIDGRLDGWLDGNTEPFSVVQLCSYTILIHTKT